MRSYFHILSEMWLSQGMQLLHVCYHRVPFFEGYKFHEWTEKEAPGNYFHESTLVSFLQSAIHVTIEFPLIFGETNFVEVPKIHEIREICSPQKKAPYIVRVFLIQ